MDSPSASATNKPFIPSNKTINEDPKWFQTLRENFEDIIIDKLDSKTRQAFEEKRIIIDEKDKKRVVWPIMHSVTEYLFLKFGGSLPSGTIFKKIAAELGMLFQFSKKF